MNIVLNVIKKIELLIGTIFMICIVLLVFIAAVIRWVGFPVAWSIDVAQLLFGWVVFLGADIALKNDSHIGVDMFVNKLPFIARKTIKIINFLFIQTFLLAIIYYGVNLSRLNYERLFNTLRISYSYATISVPVGAFLMFLTMCQKLIKVFYENEDNASLENNSVL
jgi:TRAP-type C4-dicarboxylate transport system permease small subunit